MLGIDTNVVVRLVVADDAEQTRRARKLIDQALGREEPVLVSLLVLLESEWVLRSRYGFSREALLSIFRALLEARELLFEDEPALEEALFHWRNSACGFSDCLITAHNRQMGCRATATFDGKAARLPGTVPI
jgi:predicted nucleic-acid-binding protein